MALPVDTIFADINPSWYQTRQPTENGELWWSTPLYFTVPAGYYAFYQSTGTQSQTIDSLRWDAARFLANARCTGNITNVRPKNFDPKPIYFR